MSSSIQLRIRPHPRQSKSLYLHLKIGCTQEELIHELEDGPAIQIQKG